MTKSEEIKDLAEALAKAQGEIGNPEKNAENPYYNSRYADLAEVLKVVRPVFAKNGLSFIQIPTAGENFVTVETMLMHNSGQWIKDAITSPVTPKTDKKSGELIPVNAQNIGSVITYLRRYSLAAFACVAQEDDDANSALPVKGESKKDPSLPPEPMNNKKPNDFI